MKHGPIALIDENDPHRFPRAAGYLMYDKTMYNPRWHDPRPQRGVPIIALATEGDKQIRKVADDVIYLPKSIEPLAPFSPPCPCNWFAYHIAVRPRLRRGQAAQPGKKRDGAVIAGA